MSDWLERRIAEAETAHERAYYEAIRDGKSLAGAYEAAGQGGPDCICPGAPIPRHTDECLEHRGGVVPARVPQDGACEPGRPCRHALFHSAFNHGQATRGQPDKATREVVERLESWFGGRFDLADHADRIANGYLDGRAGDRWRLRRVLAACPLFPAPRDTGADG